MEYVIWLGLIVANGIGAWSLYDKVNKPEARFTDKVFYVMALCLTFALASMFFGAVI